MWTHGGFSALQGSLGLISRCSFSESWLLSQRLKRLCVCHPNCSSSVKCKYSLSDYRIFSYVNIPSRATVLCLFFPLPSFSFCAGSYKGIHQEFRQITEPSVFDQQIFRRRLLQRNNFPLHFLSWTKTPLKWMAFAHSLWPQLAALWPSLVLWPQNRTRRMKGDGGGWHNRYTHETTAIIAPHPSGLGVSGAIYLVSLISLLQMTFCLIMKN